MNLILGLLIGAAVFVGAGAAIHEEYKAPPPTAQEMPPGTMRYSVPLGSPEKPVEHVKPKAGAGSSTSVPTPKPRPKAAPKAPAIAAEPGAGAGTIVREHPYIVEPKVAPVAPVVVAKPEPPFEFDWWKLVAGLILGGAMGIITFVGRKLYAGYKLAQVNG